MLDPELAQAVLEIPQPPPPKDFFEARANRAKHLQQLRHKYLVPGPLATVKEDHVQAPVRDGSSITLKMYRPAKTSDEGSPLIVMYHEGGWSMGDLTDEDQNCRLFAERLGAVCVNVEYRLAPEHPFPIPWHDSWDALKWIAANASSLGADPRRGFIIGGGSAGGNLAAALAHLARDEHLDPPLTGQYLCVPAVLDDEVVPEKYKAECKSRTTNTEDPVLKGLSMDMILDVVKADPRDPLLSPFIWPGGHAGLAPAYFQVCGLDPLRDEGLLYEKVLREESGVKTKLDFYPKYGHYFWTNYPQLKASTRFVEDTVKGVEWLLQH